MCFLASDAEAPIPETRTGWIDFPRRIDDPIPQMHNAVFNCGPYSEKGFIPFGDVWNEFYPKLDAAIHETAKGSYRLGR